MSPRIDELPAASDLIDIYADPCDNLWRWIRICAIHQLSMKWFSKTHYVVNVQPFELAFGNGGSAHDLCLN